MKKSSKRAAPKKTTHAATPDAHWLAAMRHAMPGSADFAGTYHRAVECVASVLRPRFESGELRGWIEDYDSERCSPWNVKKGKDGEPERDAAGLAVLVRRETLWIPPMWRIERACTRLFITSPNAALNVLQSASALGRSKAPFRWRGRPRSTSLLGSAEAAMAVDVLAYARARGWSKPKPGEERTPRPRVSVAHGCEEGVA